MTIFKITEIIEVKLSQRNMMADVNTYIKEHESKAYLNAEHMCDGSHHSS